MADSSPTRPPLGQFAENPPGAEDPSVLMIADRLASLGTLVAGVAHEINNPITYVLSNLADLERLAGAMQEAILTYRARLGELVGEGAADLITAAEAKVHQAGGVEILDELVSDAHEGCVRIRDLVRDLLAVSRSSERSSAPVDVHTILDSSLRLVTKQLASRAALERQYQATCTVGGDRAKLAQVFLNLITNAVHACTPPDPSRHTISVRTRDTQDGIEVEVEDSGEGIRAEIRDKIFSPFFTTKAAGGGTGLGLYISHRIVEEHGGSIHFRCGASSGTIFSVRLPQGEESPAEPPRES